MRTEHVDPFTTQLCGKSNKRIFAHFHLVSGVLLFHAPTGEKVLQILRAVRLHLIGPRLAFSQCLTVEHTPRFIVVIFLSIKEIIVPKHSKPKISTSTRITLLAGIACIGCCAIPLVGVTIGSAAMAGLAAYSDLAICGVVMAGFLAFILWRVMRRDGPSCDLDGRCKPNRSSDLTNHSR